MGKLPPKKYEIQNNHRSLILKHYVFPLVSPMGLLWNLSSSNHFYRKTSLGGGTKFWISAEISRL